MKNKLSRFAVPYEVWMAIFVVAPILIMVIYAFSSSEGGFTLDNFVQMGGYTQVFLRSFKLAIIATLICLVIGYPVSYLMSREGPAFQRTAMVLIMLPMWMNFLLRTYSWMTILENHGLLNQLFEKIGLISLYNHIFGTELEYFSMMNTQGAVVLGMVYNYLPFMILPIYSVIIKLDGSLLEAARDLGANSMTVFRRVILPLSLPGVISGITMVFVPSVSTFAISRMLGGGTELLLGDLIERQFLGGAYNPQLGAAISLVLIVVVLVAGYCKLILIPINDQISSYRLNMEAEQTELDANQGKMAQMQKMQKAIEEIKAAGEKRTIPQYDNSGKLMIELHEIMSDTLDYSLDCSAGTVQQDYIMLRPIVMTFRTSTYAQARQIVDRLCSSENISQISDMNMNTYTEGRNSGTVETTLVITYFEIMP